MKQVVDISTNTNTLTAEITSAAERQKQSIYKITDSIGKISDVVQQNSSTAEQTAASCQELSTEDKALQDQIMRLRV